MPTIEVAGLGEIEVRPLLGKHLDIVWACEQTPPDPNAYMRLVSVACEQPKFSVTEAGELQLNQLLQIVDQVLDLNEKKTQPTG